MFSLLFSPVGRVVVLLMLVVGLTTYGIHLIRQSAIQEIERKATEDALRRVENAVRAGDAVDTSPDRVRESDGHKRD